MATATFVLASLVWSLLASASICRRAYSFEIEKLRQSRELLISHLYLFHGRASPKKRPQRKGEARRAFKRWSHMASILPFMRAGGTEQQQRSVGAREATAYPGDQSGREGRIATPCAATERRCVTYATEGLSTTPQRWVTLLRSLPRRCWSLI